jgi:preprotein translocase subunit SecF
MGDTIVVFDRIRENLELDNRTRCTELVNASIDQTTSRTILTSGLTFLTAMSLWLFGGPVLHSFSLAPVIGIMIGTYSPIFIASPIIVALWNKWQEDRKQPRVAVALASSSMLRRVTAKALK